MAGSHRAPAKTRLTKPRRTPGSGSRTPRWTIALAVVLALVPATWFTVHRLVAHPTSAPHDSASDLPIPPVSPRATTPAPQAPTSSAASPTPVARLPKVAPNAPRRLQAGTLLDTGFDNAVTTLEPASTSEVARLQSRGSPGSPGTDTVVVVGKVYAGGSSALGHLPEVTPGATVSIRTDSGTLTYTVAAAVQRPLAGLESDPSIARHVPGRLVLVGIRYAASGDRLADALVVTARLTGATPA